MTSLRGSPFNLKYQDYVIVKLLAHNSRGWSIESAESMGPQIESEPIKMSVPTEGS